MAELVDALDSGSSQGNLVDVRVILAANSLPISLQNPPLIHFFLRPETVFRNFLFFRFYRENFDFAHFF